GYPEFIIAYKNETAIDDDITLTQKDIREIQLAKAAIRAGIEILLKKARIRIEDIERIYVAGAFGFYLNPISAMNIGLFPKDIDVKRILLVGNTALMGAKAILLSNTLREEVKEIIKKVEYVELAIQPDFQKEFIKAIPFPKI
ncbi:MAG: ASKHA domain-containing protein, partial [Saccharolobus sp.]|uniref:ASKHA domain-containing protein n=1 Tax=Saccharolobus sp. TaxID=2100761 RepID=UPI00318064BB